jgi:hypothetical protein
VKLTCLALGAIAAFTLAGASQAAVTYTLLPVSDTSCCAVGVIDVNGTITTDGATGVLSASDILSWNITLSDSGFPDEHLSNTTPSSDLVVEGAYLTATSTGLYWDFAGGAGAQFSISPPSQSTTEWHIYTNRWDVNFNGVEYANYQDGNQLIGTTSVPEPSTWAMMLVGMSGLGVALRSRRKTVHSHA